MKLELKLAESDCKLTLTIYMLGLIQFLGLVSWQLSNLCLSNFF